MSTDSSSNPAYLDSVALTQRLVRFDTTNPPGNEVQCIEHIKALRDDAGIQNQVLAKAPGRPQSHSPAARRRHSRTFAASRPHRRGACKPRAVAASTLWWRPGRRVSLVTGFAGQKNGIAMMLHAILRAKTDGMTPAGDIVLAVVSDEKSGGAILRDQVRHRRVRRVQLSNGRAAVLPDHGRRKAGLPSSGDLPGHRRPRISGRTTQPNDRDGPVPTAGPIPAISDPRNAPEARIMFQAIGRHVSLPARAGIAALLNPRFTASTLKLMGGKGRTFSPLFRNTVNPISVRRGGPINVVPDKASVDLDGRILPNLSRSC